MIGNARELIESGRLMAHARISTDPAVMMGKACITGTRITVELILRKLTSRGFKRIDLSVGHLGGLIKAYLDSVELPSDVDLRYWWEDEPMGTAGALRRIDDLDEPFLAMNGDILTTFDYGELMRFHLAHDGELTIATHRQDVDIDLGVIESDEG